MFKFNTGQGSKTLAALAAGLLFMVPAPAFAPCENAVTATSQFNTLVRDLASDLNDFIEQESNFIDDKITKTATDEVSERLEEFDENFRAGMSEWWRDHFLPALQDMTAQLHAANIDQSMAFGKLMDGQMLNEFSQEMQFRQVEAQRRYMPSETTCQVDTVGPGMLRAQRMARAVTRALTVETQPLRMNGEGTISEGGTGEYVAKAWEEYTSMFCDPDKGGMGCGATPGTRAGEHTDIPSLLWGDKLTIDATDAENQQVINAALRYLISPWAPDPIAEDVVDTPAGREALLQRRAQAGRVNAVYMVMSQLISERVGGSGVDTSDVRTAAGLPPADASSDASYREIVNAVNKDRFHNPEYVVRMVSNPEQVVREKGAVTSMLMQQMNDLYKRMEEMVFMEASVYAGELDARMPSQPAVRPMR